MKSYFFLLFITFSLSLAAQDIPVGYAFYGSVGGLSLPCLGCDSGGSDVILSIQGSLERNKKRNATATRMTLGAMLRDEVWSPKVAFTGVYLSGKNKHHFELDYGVLYTKAFDPALLPIVNIGYRYQDLKSSSAVFRLGLGLEYLGPFTSFGWSF